MSLGNNIVGKGETATILVRWVDVSRTHASILVESTRVVTVATANP